MHSQEEIPVNLCDVSRDGKHNKFTQELRLGWPATEWEPTQNQKLAEKWPAAISFGGGGPKTVEKWPGKWPDMQKTTKF